MQINCANNRDQKKVIIYPPNVNDYINDYIEKYFPNYPGNNKPEKPEEDKLKVKIKSVVEDEFVVVGEDEYLYATGKKSNENGIFKLVMINENEIKLRLVGGDFIRVDNKDFLIADTDKKGATKFKLYKLDNKSYALKAPNGYYVRVREKDKKLVAKAENAGNRTIFKFKTVE
ncbi:MAG: fascin domain-containing protein [Paraclostridium sp.]|uniref:fascin domain-containing protein n=1 Tax=Paraclostridium sp. TaxID=2023273 RepID=UPI003F417A33